MTRRTAEPSYRTAHARVQRLKGRASDYECVDCGGRAAEWSYTNHDADEREAVHNGSTVRFSRKPEHYETRCRPCHYRYDKRHRDRLMTDLALFELPPPPTRKERPHL